MTDPTPAAGAPETRVGVEFSATVESWGDEHPALIGIRPGDDCREYPKIGERVTVHRNVGPFAAGAPEPREPRELREVRDTTTRMQENALWHAERGHHEMAVSPDWLLLVIDDALSWIDKISPERSLLAAVEAWLAHRATDMGEDNSVEMLRWAATEDRLAEAMRSALIESRSTSREAEPMSDNLVAGILLDVEYLMEEHGTGVIALDDLRAVAQNRLSQVERQPDDEQWNVMGMEPRASREAGLDAERARFAFQRARATSIYGTHQPPFWQTFAAEYAASPVTEEPA